jgi:hypothetical protein
MAESKPLRVIILKPGKYAADGFVERFRRGFMPNSTLPHLRAMTPARVGAHACEVRAIDEYVQTDLRYLDLLHADPSCETLLALVGVQSHQFQRALDLTAYARHHGVRHAVIGGPHPMTCDTTPLHGRGVSFALAEAELVWPDILADAGRGELQPVYGAEQRWQETLVAPPVSPPDARDLRRYVARLLGIYPARGCPYRCNFCSVIKIAGRQVRSQPIETTLASLRTAQDVGVRFVMFTSDNFNKYPEVNELLQAMIDERIRLPFFAQCDAQIEAQEELIALLARAGCFQMFVGAESFSREALRAAHKLHNHPERYSRIVGLCRAHGITSHFSNIIGFPSDTEAGIEQHLATLRELAPDVASFYILTPIPGTEQYDEFLAGGLITETDLDRFDGSCVTWRHPNLAPDRLRQLLFRCYRRFYAAADVSRKLACLAVSARDFRRTAALLSVAGCSSLGRYGAARGIHPMAGGFGRVRRDRLEDYLPLRRRRFGLERVPLPASLALSARDQRLNEVAKLA